MILRGAVVLKKVVVCGDLLAGGEVRGIQRYAYEILRELVRLPRPYEIELLVPKSARIRAEDFENLKIVRYGRLSGGFLWRQICFPAYARKERAVSVDLMLALPISGCGVVCLHDCIYENMPSAFPSFKEKVKRRSYLFRAARLAKRADRLLTVSQNTKNELMAHYGLAADRVSLVPCAWQHFDRLAEDEKVFSRLGLKPDQVYFFALGSGLKHKNFEWVVQAAAQNPSYQFIVTGNNRLSDYGAEISRQKLENLTFTGYLSDQEVKALMRRARAFLHPSLYEGFGIPPLEALSVGTEIIISNASCLPEIYGDAARYIDPRDYRIDMDEILRREFNPESDVLQRYSWSKSAQALDAILTEMAAADAKCEV
jgi:glycosyltransferase involved in cell wall biosynthesis